MPRDTVRADQLARILEVSRELAKPFDLEEILEKIVTSGRDVLDADRGSVFLYDEEPHELYTVVSTGVEGIRIPADAGIVGEAARTRSVINVPNAYADERFNQAVDRKTGYRTHCLITVPMVGHDDELVGVLQLLNKRGGVFDQGDEELVEVLAAQCAVALQRVQMTNQLIESERMTRELALAREVQTGLFPRDMPTVEGYDFAALSVPAEETGGDTYDLLTRADGNVVILLGDATGHGLAPALSVTQVRSMLRMGLHLEADMSELTFHINRQLVQDLPSNRFVTAFLGLLDPTRHRIGYHAAGQAPLMIYRAADDTFEWRDASTMPLGLFDLPELPGSVDIEMAPGDIVGLITDGLFERENAAGEQFGQEGSERIVRASRDGDMAGMLERLLQTSLEWGNFEPQDDDITLVLIRRDA